MKIKAKIICAIFLLTSGFCMGQIQSSYKALIKPKINDSKNIVFGLELGKTTYEEIKKRAKPLSESICNSGNNSYCSLQPNTYDKIEKNGEIVVLKNDDSLKHLDIISADFNIDDDYFSGKFLNGILFEILIKKLEYQNYYKESVQDELNFILDLKLALNGKYNKIGIKRTVDDQVLMTFNNKYEYWESANKQMIVTLHEVKKVVKNESHCLDIVNTLPVKTRASIEFKYDCHEVTDNIGKYTISYAHKNLKYDAFNMLKKTELQIINEENEKSKSKLNKY